MWKWIEWNIVELGSGFAFFVLIICFILLSMFFFHFMVDKNREMSIIKIDEGFCGMADRSLKKRNNR